MVLVEQLNMLLLWSAAATAEMRYPWGANTTGKVFQNGIVLLCGTFVVIKKAKQRYPFWVGDG